MKVLVTGEESEGCGDWKGVGWMWRQEVCGSITVTGRQ